MIVDDFFVDVQLAQGLTRIQVEEATPYEQAVLNILLFTIDFYNGKSFTTLTLQLENGNWHLHDNRFTDDTDQLHFHEFWEDYNCPLTRHEISTIGAAISNYMVVQLVSRMSLFVASLPNPAVN
ncbi:hypothetical protein [Mucilaginibacter ginkgonis]|uniref:Uncharacterized protein n=1 Tax=Mucilaginibacter ginkgonis TaxID=2682091 RepID=A0A6I4HWC8_9SPHI|nr:hypothetical protein [Mucilaginibacter ginkgonis]QQL51249.1 hypothetical protein GO620_007315 [Mucilaginibacter ginkgonis]